MYLLPKLAGYKYVLERSYDLNGGVYKKKRQERERDREREWRESGFTTARGLFVD